MSSEGEKIAAHTFRLMQEQDLEAVIALVQEASEFAWTAKKILASLRSEHDSSYLLCEQDSGQIVGYAVLHHVLDECHLLNIAILKKQQGKGLGRLLLKRLIDEVSGKSYRTMYLEVRASNQIAIRLYEGLGFIRGSVRRAYYPARNGREDALLYSLSLS